MLFGGESQVLVILTLETELLGDLPVFLCGWGEELEGTLMFDLTPGSSSNV